MLLPLELYVAFSVRSERLLIECASLAPSMLCTWFRHRVSIALERSLGMNEIHARFLLLKEYMALLPSPLPRAPLYFVELYIVVSFGKYDWFAYVSY